MFRPEALREAADATVRVARHVRVVQQNVPKYAASFSPTLLQNVTLDRRHSYEADREDTIAYFFTLATINFGSGYSTHLAKIPGHSGHFTMASHLKNHFNCYGKLEPEVLAELSASDCCRLFAQPSDCEPCYELMRHFARALNDLGIVLSSKYQGRFSRFVNEAEGSAARLIEMLLEMSYFRDIATYASHTLPFLKRAQLLAADLSVGLGDLEMFCDLKNLTVFADNVIPHVLRMDGLLEYSDSLMRRIAAGETIQSGSEEEVEIRASTVHVVDLIVSELNCQSPTTAWQLDYALWYRGQDPVYKAQARHRTRTVFY